MGLTHYFDGPVCKNGHDDARYVSDRSCVECKMDKHFAHPDWRPRQPAILTADPAYPRKWYAANRDGQREKQRARRQEKPEIYRAHSSNRRARDKQAEGSHSAQDLRQIRALQKDRCGYCRVNLAGGGELDHIRPLARGGSNWPRNLQYLCVPCNHTKRARDPVEFAQSLGKLL